RFGRADKPWRVPELGAPVAHRVAAKTLQTQELSVRFGGIVALENLSITVHPGEVVGLIGPNGAGKTTAVEALPALNRPRGQVRPDGAPVLGWGRGRRSRAGLGRSFQALELCEDMTVLENLQAASDTRDAAAYGTNLVYSGKRKLSAAAAAA